MITFRLYPIYLGCKTAGRIRELSQDFLALTHEFVGEFCGSNDKRVRVGRTPSFQFVTKYS